MLSHLLVISLGSPTDDSDFAARHLIHRFDYVGVDQHVAILLADLPSSLSASSPGCSKLFHQSASTVASLRGSRGRNATLGSHG
jgi:hypothetical protein